MGQCLEQLGRLDEAAAEYQTIAGVGLRPISSSIYNFNSKYTEKSYAHFLLGSLAKRRGRIEDAVHEFSRAVLYQPDVPNRYLDLGEALAEAGRDLEAESAFEQVLRLTEGCPKDTTETELRRKAEDALGTLHKRRGGEGNLPTA